MVLPVLMLVAISSNANAITLDFNTSSVNDYAPLGVTFSANASIWSFGGPSVLDNPSGGPYSVPNGLQFGSAGGVIGYIYFDQAQAYVSIWALSGPGPDLLNSPIYIKAYDAADQLIDEDFADNTVQFDLLSVNGAGIVKIETFSPVVNNDVWDDLTFDSVPAPASFAVLMATLPMVRVRRLRAS